MKFWKLDLSKMKLVLLTDASIANTKGVKSQLRYILLMPDDHGTSNTIHYCSTRCRRVTRSVMASEIHALVLWFDRDISIRHLIQEILVRAVEVQVYVDSKTVFDVIAKDGQTNERSLQIDICALQETYANGEVTKLGWIPGESNPSESLTKQNTRTKTASGTL